MAISRTPAKTTPTTKLMTRIMSASAPLTSRRHGPAARLALTRRRRFRSLAVKHGFADRIGQRIGRLERRHDRQDHQEVEEVVGRCDLAERDVERVDLGTA